VRRCSGRASPPLDRGTSAHRHQSWIGLARRGGSAPCLGSLSETSAKVALQHNLGLGGACVMTMYRRD